MEELLLIIIKSFLQKIIKLFAMIMKAFLYMNQELYLLEKVLLLNLKY